MGYPHNVLQVREGQCRRRDGHESYELEGAFTNAQAHQHSSIDLRHQHHLKLEGLPRFARYH